MLAQRHPLDPMFNPGSVAVFGASERTDSVGGQVFRNLIESGFSGGLFPVNPKYRTVFGRDCAAAIDASAVAPELAVIATPASTISGILEQCASVGCRHVIILSAGVTDGDAHEATDPLNSARRSDMRILGPNCVGLIRPWIDLNASFLRGGPPKGRLALVSQSGALISAISDWSAPNHLGFSALVSLGNAADIDFGEVVEFLADDPKTDAIMLYAEGIRDGASFISALRYATWRKPVIVLKAGRGEAASRAAATHTGSLMANDDVFNAALDRTGAVRAETFGQLFAAAEILGSGKRADGNALGIVTNGGGAGVLAADRAEDMRVALPPPSDSIVHRLENTLPPHWSRSNPIDVLGDASAETFGDALRVAVRDPNFNGLLAMLTPQAMTDPLACADALIAAVADAAKLPVLACWMGESSVEAARDHLSQAGIPDFTTPERAVEAFSFLAQHHRKHELALEVPPPRRIADANVIDARKIIAKALDDGRTVLSSLESRDLIRCFGLPVDDAILVQTNEELREKAHRVGFPLAMKIYSHDITHKSDVDGVRLGIETLEAAEHHFTEIVVRARELRPDADVIGVTIEPMSKLRDARELLLGVSRDPVFGPVIVFGLGGTMVEVLRDRALALPPLNAVLADRLVAKTKASAILGPFRNLPAADVDALRDALLRLSDMVSVLPELTELDINPLLVGPDGVLALDARVVVSRVATEAGETSHLAIAPFPRHIDIRDTLSDGQSIRIRPIRADDAENEDIFVRNLSPKTSRLRFFGAMRALTPEMLARFTQIDYRRELALIALVGEPERRQQVGVARYHVDPGRESCEFAVVVADAYQGKGVGRKLMQALIAEARRLGISRMEGTILRENKAMRRFCRSLGFKEADNEEDTDVVEVTKDLTND